MALPDYFKQGDGTTVTPTITLTSLTNNAARQGTKVDFGALRSRVWRAKFRIAMNAAGTNGSSVDLYLGFSSSATAGTGNDGSLSGTDAALSNPLEIIPQLAYLGSVIISNALGTATQESTFLFTTPSRYACPVVYNRATGQSLSGTSGNFLLEFVPQEESVEDTL